MEEKVTRKGVCSKPLKYSYRFSEEGNKEINMPSRSTPTLCGPRNQDGKHHQKPRRYNMVSCLVIVARKEGIQLENVGTLEGQATPVGTIAHVLQIHWTLGDQMLEASLGTPSQEPNK